MFGSHGITGGWKVMADVGYHHIGSFPSKRQGMRGAQSMRGTGDNRNFTFKSG
jgi:hypothetical protein